MFFKLKEAPLAFNTSHGSLHWDHMPKALKAHVGVKDTWESQGPYVQTVFPEHVVYSHGGETFKQKYSIKHGPAGSDPEISFLGNKKKVHTAYVDSADQAQESMRFLTDGFVAVQNDPRGETQSVVTTLSEGEVLVNEGVIFDRVKESDSALPKPIEVKLISAGWGSSGYYPKEVLQRDGPTVYAKGTHMYWNHATESQEQDRPEGDLSDLAAVLTENAVWKETGAKGPGLYSHAKVFSDYATQVAEKGPHIGVSINTYVKGKEGEAEGRTGRIVEKLIKTNMNSVDFVTRAGAGGAPIVHAQESNRGQQSGKETTMTDQEAQALVEKNKVLEAQLVKLQESQNQVLAVATVGATLREADIPFNVKLLTRACSSPVVKEGKLDEAWIKSVVDDFSEGFEGHVTDMGHGRESDTGRERTTTTKTNDDKKLKEAFKDLGVPEAGLEIAVNFGRD